MIFFFSVEESLRLGPGEDLFDFLASCIKDFLLTHRYSFTHGLNIYKDTKP
jgi:hypothetical protein